MTKKKIDENNENTIAREFLGYFLKIVFVIILIYASIYGVNYYRATNNEIYTEDAMISAPVIVLGPINAGVLDNVFVSSGDIVQKKSNCCCCKWSERCF